MKVFLIALAVAVLALGACGGVHARDGGQWADQPPEIRAWFGSVMQPGGRASCCGEGDAYDVELDGDAPDGSIRAVVVDGHGVIPDGTLVIVPRERLQAKYGNPLDKVILFIGANGKPLCLIPRVGA